jgi:hypothetical protein
MTNTAHRTGATNVDVPNAKLTPKATVTLHRLARELRLTDQILSDDLDTVSIVDNGPAPAWTTLEGDHITFALSRMPFPETAVDVAVWLGTNAHELGHVLFSPRRQSPLMVRIVAGDKVHLRGIVDLHNIVEDQRQERLVLARFAPWAPYLTAALGHHIPVAHENAWVLLAGRTWLPQAVRDTARARFVARYGAASADAVAHIVGEYQRLTDPGESEAIEAWDLLVALHELFGTDVPRPKQRCVSLEGGEPDTGEAGADAPPAADETGEGDGEAPGEGEGEGSGEGECEGSGEGGAGASEGSASAPSLSVQIKRAAAEQLAAEGDDIANVLDALRAGRGSDDVRGEDSPGTYQPATDAARRLHHEVADALLDLKDDAEPGWDRRTDSGRLNVGRLINPAADMDELFDRYAPGAMESTEVELVLLLDVSGSMSSRMAQLGEAAWAIRHAVDDLDGTATVITWNDAEPRIMAAAGDHPDARMFVPHAGGGTNPTEALGHAYRLLADSTARNRLVVILSDGRWADVRQAERVVQACNDAGMVTVCGLLGRDAGTRLHGCTHGRVLSEPADLARLFQSVAAAQMLTAR